MCIRDRLFAFFVVMYAMSSVNESKYQIFSASLTSAFGKQIVKPAAIVPASEQGLLLKSLVDRRNAKLAQQQQEAMQDIAKKINQVMSCLLYTSDAADERSSVDLGGRRIIKKKKEGVAR